MKKRLIWLVTVAAILTSLFATTPLALAAPVLKEIKTYSLDLAVTSTTDCFDVYFDGTNWHRDYPEPYLASGYGKATEYKWGSGIRFANVNIPKEAKITRAYIVFTAYRNLANTTVNTRITGNKETDAGPFTTWEDYAARRGIDAGGTNNSRRTGSQTSWDNIEPWITDNTYQTPDISLIIQEIVDQSGWLPGNHMAVFWDDHEGRSSANFLAARSAYSYFGSSTKSPKLHIEYVPGSKSRNTNNKAVGKENAPGQNKMKGEPATGKAIGKEEAPGQIKEPGEPATGKAVGKEEAPGQGKEPGERAEEKEKGKQ